MRIVLSCFASFLPIKFALNCFKRDIPKQEISRSEVQVPIFRFRRYGYASFILLLPAVLALRYVLGSAAVWVAIWLWSFIQVLPKTN
jgi:hypothetical protein